tara:strand:- start:13465 stop:13608 length:144 start_codon:yes stop_codon:yes gene_type:complete
MLFILKGFITQTILSGICLIDKGKIKTRSLVFSMHFETIFAASYLMF